MRIMFGFFLFGNRPQPLIQRAGDKADDLDVMPNDQPLFSARPGRVERGEISDEFERQEFGKDVAARGTAQTPSQDAPAGERSCPLNELPQDAIISRDVFTADGSLFMHAGTQLTPLIISILVDLQDLGHSVDEIRIAT